MNVLLHTNRACADNTFICHVDNAGDRIIFIGQEAYIDKADDKITLLTTWPSQATIAGDDIAGDDIIFIGHEVYMNSASDDFTITM